MLKLIIIESKYINQFVTNKSNSLVAKTRFAFNLKSLNRGKDIIGKKTYFISTYILIDSKNQRF